VCVCCKLTLWLTFTHWFVVDSKNIAELCVCQLLQQNFNRVKRCIMVLLSYGTYINSCFEWESAQRSIISFVVWKSHIHMLVNAHTLLCFIACCDGSALVSCLWWWCGTLSSTCCLWPCCCSWCGTISSLRAEKWTIWWENKTFYLCEWVFFREFHGHCFLLCCSPWRPCFNGRMKKMTRKKRYCCRKQKREGSPSFGFKVLHIRTL